MDSLQGVPLVELTLDGNPVSNKYKDQNTYIRYYSYSLDKNKIMKYFFFCPW